MQKSEISLPGSLPRRLLHLLLTACAITWLGALILAQTTPARKKSGAAAKSAPQPAPLTAAEIMAAREKLGQLGYWVDLEVTGLDASLYHALIAFQKIEGRKLTGKLTRAEIAALETAYRPVPQETGTNHIEVDLTRQVLFVVDCCGAILRTLPISSGSGEWFTEGGKTRQAITPTGKFKITRQIKGWRKSPLGLLYYPNYLQDGIAIHGNPAVPTFPASHGCVRIPMFAAKEFSEMVKIGMPVIIYGLPPLRTPSGS